MHLFCAAIFALSFVANTLAETKCTCQRDGAILSCILDNPEDVFSVAEGYCNYFLLRVELNLLRHTNLSADDVPKIETTFLNITGKHLKRVSENAFSNQVKSLRSLEIINTNITEIPTAAIKNLKKLWGLDLSRNAIRYIDCSLQGVNLFDLTLDGNNISSIYNCGIPRSLIGTLSLNNNRLESLNGSVKYHRITTFYAKYNAITSLDDELIGMNELKRLKASWNRIQSVNLSPENLPKLAFLDLSHNLISNLGRSLKGFTNMRTMALSYNKLQNVDENIFTEMKDLWFLDLRCNMIQSFNHQKLLSSLRRLYYLFKGNSTCVFND